MYDDSDMTTLSYY